jgi:sugar phosphate isomerase/epimerase
MAITTAQLVASPACIPQWTLQELLPAYAKLGFSKFEAFCTWCKSALDIAQPAESYLSLARHNATRFTSMHLPPITNDRDASLASAIATARYAASLGADVVLYKADSRENYIGGAAPFLDALARERIEVTPVLQNHRGTPITTLDDFRAVIEGIADPRMMTLLEVGHFARVGVDWRTGYDLLGQSIALVHINDIDGAGQSVPFGKGSVDFKGLFAHLSEQGYAGNIVVELELDTRQTDPQRTLRELRNSLAHLRKCGIKED